MCARRAPRAAPRRRPPARRLTRSAPRPPALPVRLGGGPRARAVIKLVEALQNESLGKYNKTPKLIPHRVENLNLALNPINKFCKDVGIKLQYSCEQVMEGNIMQIMGLFWVLISRFMIANISEDELSAKEALLLWCQKKTEGYAGVSVSDFHNSWQNGLAFCALIHRHRPDLVDFASLSPANAEENLNTAFEAAAAHLGVPKLLDAEDIVSARPDEKSVMTYLSFVWKTFAAGKTMELAGNRIASLVEKERQNENMRTEYETRGAALLAWVEEKKRELGEAAEIGGSVAEVQETASRFIEYKRGLKVEKQEERGTIESIFSGLNAKLLNEKRPNYTPPAHLASDVLVSGWEALLHTERSFEEKLYRELKRLKHQEAVEQSSVAMAERYETRSKALLEWARGKAAEFGGEEFGETSREVGARQSSFEEYKRGTKSSMTSEKAALASLYSHVCADRSAVSLPAFEPVTGEAEVSECWAQLEDAEDAYEARLREAIAVRRRHERLLERVEKEAFDIEDWMKTNEAYLLSEVPECGSVSDAEAEVARLQATSDSFTKNTYSGESLLAMVDTSPLKTTESAELREGLHSIISVLAEFGKTLEEKRLKVNENLKAQLKAESVRLQFSKRAEELVAWCNGMRESLDGILICYSMADVDAEENMLDAHVEDRRARETTDLAELEAMDAETHGVNPYARYAIGDIKQALAAVVGSEDTRRARIGAERTTQAEHDTLRRAFAGIVEEFEAFAADVKQKIAQTDALAASSASSAEEQISGLGSVESDLSSRGGELLKRAADTSNELLSAGITDNEYTNMTTTELNMEYEVLKRIIKVKMDTVEADVATKASAEVSEDTMREMTEVFGKFDKDGDGLLTEKEAANVLLAYDLEATAEEFKALTVTPSQDDEARIDLQHFSDFFSAKLRNADTEEQVIASFGVLKAGAAAPDGGAAAGPATITEAELARVLSAADVAYLKERMPPLEDGAYDFGAYVQSVYQEDADAQQRKREEAQRVREQLERKQAEEAERRAQEEAERAREEAAQRAAEEEKARKEEEKKRIEAEAQARKAEAERLAAEEEARRVAEEQEQIRREAEERARLEAEEQAKKLQAELEEQERQRREAEAKAEEERRRMQEEMAFKSAVADAEKKMLDGKNGFLLKQGGRHGGFKSWNRRYCTLSKEGELGVLRWYASKAHFTASPRGELVISFGTEISKEEMKGRGMCLRIANKDDVPFYALPESANALSEWWAVLRLFSTEDMPKKEDYVVTRRGTII